MTRDRLIGGRYRLAEKIGHGGMGQVWAGYDERLDRRVAVKLLRADLSTAHDQQTPTTSGTRDSRADLRKRFLRECRITAALDHPGLVTVFDAGEDDGELFLVMQRVPGAGLADLIAEEGRFPVDRAAAVAAQLCAALAVVHAVPAVHRDLKPSNVMVRPDGRVVLLDLGIATALDTDRTRLTMTGVPIGSPSYMAPEQALSGSVDARSDLYALGCLLHEMLTGEQPFPASTALGVLRRQVDDPPVPLRRLRPEVPAELEALVLELLAKPPAGRPADAQQVFGRLLPLVGAAAAAGAAPVAGQGDPTAPFRRPLAPVPAPTLAPAVPLLPPVPSAPPVTFAAPARAATPAPAPAAQFPPPPAPAPVGDLAAACGQVSDLLAEQRYAEVIDLAARLLPRAVAAHGEQAPLVGTLRTIYARTLLQEGQYRAALPEYQLLAGQAAGASALEYRLRVAECLEHLGRVPEALAGYQALLADCSARLAAGTDTDPARCWDLRERIGLLLAGSGEANAAWDWLLPLLLDREPRLGPHHPDVLRVRRHLDHLQHHRPAPLPPLDPRTRSWWRSPSG
ncbi:serine/threonine-protein kinase [Kitasatospora viridis]|uniref:non-specific serine/threonine protein kinase n=1 Tax=Kitasatospora viridis TaxID=281105 RepID=A0A561UFS9_9ACTN|nr:serine/threonine-protein kinase [Kitasatospora viridis]TWF98222.1 serine/threonine protein kinase [Kitasatospora viridis]